MLEDSMATETVTAHCTMVSLAVRRAACAFEHQYDRPIALGCVRLEVSFATSKLPRFLKGAKNGSK
jgi:hypothetical protein